SSGWACAPPMRRRAHGSDKSKVVRRAYGTSSTRTRSSALWASATLSAIWRSTHPVFTSASPPEQADDMNTLRHRDGHLAQLSPYCVAGRSPTAHVRLASNAASSEHAAFHLIDGAWYLR